jgi:hypothetical protein
MESSWKEVPSLAVTSERKTPPGALWASSSKPERLQAGAAQSAVALIIISSSSVHSRDRSDEFNLHNQSFDRATGRGITGIAISFDDYTFRGFRFDSIIAIASGLNGFRIRYPMPGWLPGVSDICLTKPSVIAFMSSA